MFEYAHWFFLVEMLNNNNNVSFTIQNPDIVIINNNTKEISLLEPTYQSKKHIEIRHKEKIGNYAHFTTDITAYKCNGNCFEVSSKRFISTRNHTKPSTSHKFMKSSIEVTQYKKNISAISLTASHMISISRNDATFQAPPFCHPLFVDKVRGPG